ATLPAGSTGGFGIFVNATTPQGLYTMTVRGSVGGSSPKTVTVFVQVLVALIPITAGPSGNVTQTTSGKSQNSAATNPPPKSPGEIAPDSGEKISSSTELLPANLRVVVGTGGSQPLSAGQVTEAVIYGENLQDAKSVQVSGSGITAEVLEAQPGELRVRFTVSANAAAGARVLSVQTLKGRATTTVEIAPGNRALLMEGAESELPIKGRRVPADAKPNATETAGALADLVVRREDITVTPSSPKAGETVTFRVRVSNEGARAVENGVLEFVIEGAGISQRENFSLAPQQSQTFTFEWVAGGRGRLVPRVALDPDNSIAESNRANNRLALPAFVMTEALPAQPAVRKATAVREQMQIRLAPGVCVGIRLSTAREVDCESGDIAIRATPAGESATLEADGIQSVGIISLDAIKQPPSGGSSRSAALAPNTSYVVEIGQRHYALRVVQVRALRATRRPPPEALRTPSVKGADVDVLAGSSGQALVIVLQWSALP
ncbi:MAG TPA: CARDB domain-containing protein, partial [Candidatus Nitrosotenuis sp.]|nr:CARDB domain-containing protein [Candidatus Nitrosotenuis sp.]